MLAKYAYLKEQAAKMEIINKNIHTFRKKQIELLSSRQLTNLHPPWCCEARMQMRI